MKSLNRKTKHVFITKIKLMTKQLMKPEVAASDICIYLNQMIDVRLKRECMFVLFIILTARVNGQMIRLVLCC